MSSVFFILLLGLNSVFAQAAESVVKRSSSIPDKREFPLNEKINPCENFYEYVCSKAIDSFQLREDRSSHTFSFNDSHERLLEKKKSYFKKLSRAKAESETEVALQNYYNSCMLPQSAAQGEKREIKKFLDQFASFTDRRNILEWFEQNHFQPENTPLSWGATNNFDDPIKSDLYLNTDYMTLGEKSYYKDEAVMKDYSKLVADFFAAIKYPNAEKMAAAVVEFEKGLAEKMPAPAEFRQIVNNRSFIDKSKLLAEFPNLRLQTLLGKMPEKILIRHWIPEALAFLDNYFGTAPLEEIKAILIYQNLSSLIDDSNANFFKKKFAFNKKHLGGPNQRPDRQERCTRNVMRSFGQELDFILWKRFFPGFDKPKFVAMAEKVRSSILSNLEKNKWLSAEAKKEAMQKMKTAKLQLVAPDSEKDWNFLPKAEYSKTDFIKNRRTIGAMKIQKEFYDLNNPLNLDKWYMGPLTINAYYDASVNRFVMPVGILQYPFYDGSRSIEENLGAVGAVIGHELGHGIDDQGSRYDSNGKQRQWMGMKDLAEFSKRTSLLVEQFNQIGHNGKLTLGENIGDLVGLTNGLGAASQDPEFLNDRERVKKFFISYGRTWCQVQRPKAIENQLKTDPHSLGVARVNEQVKQQTEFRKAFQCSASDPMVLPPEKLVQIW